MALLGLEPSNEVIAQRAKIGTVGRNSHGITVSAGSGRRATRPWSDISFEGGVGCARSILAPPLAIDSGRAADETIFPIGPAACGSA